MYWATVVYFKKTEYVETFFNFVKHTQRQQRLLQRLVQASVAFTETILVLALVP